MTFEAVARWLDMRRVNHEPLYQDGKGAEAFIKRRTFTSRAEAEHWALHQVETCGAHYAEVNPLNSL